MAVKLAFNEIAQFSDGTGTPYAGGKLFTYSAGSTTKLNTYKDSGGSVANTNPIVLDSAGRVPFAVWLTTGMLYDFVLAPSTDTDPPSSPIWTLEDVAGINDSSLTIDQWVSSGLTPTFIGASSFSLSGDQTSAFHVGRRLKITDGGGTKYATITASVFGALTTVTVSVDAGGSLTNPTSAVSLGLLTATDPSTPLLTDAYPIVSGSADRTKKVRFEVDGLTTATTRVITMPDSDVTLSTVVAASTSAAGIVELLTQSEYDAGTDTTRAPTANLNRIALATEQATTSGTSIDFTGIPSGVRRITVMLVGVSTNGTSGLMLQLGDAGGFETTGYTGGTSLGTTPTAFTTGIGIYEATNAGDTYVGQIVLTLQDAAAFEWVASGATINDSAANACRTTVGRKALSAELTQIRLTTVGGANTFDAGAVNISYER